LANAIGAPRCHRGNRLRCAGQDRCHARRAEQEHWGAESRYARVFVLRDKAFAGIIDPGWRIQLDGQTMGDLKTGTFVYLDRPAGRHQLSFFRGADLAHVSRLDFDVAGGRSYYFRIELNEKGKMVEVGSSMAGVLPLLITSAAAAAVDDRGLFDFIPLDNATAVQAMAELRLADPATPPPLE
jgi:Protein of unknown function (DUF2846)